MIGAAIAFSLQWLLYDALLVWLVEADSLKLFHFVPFEQLLVPMVCVFAAAGLFVGVVGSWTSIRKFLNV
jgi:cell division protein FtsX